MDTPQMIHVMGSFSITNKRVTSSAIIIRKDFLMCQDYAFPILNILVPHVGHVP